MLNFNTQPYYDDFNEDKNFHRILFKPGVAVQARELTQAQSILQDQIGKFGKFVLSDGSNVSGGKYTIDTNVRSLDLQNIGTIATDIASFTGRYVVGETSKSVSLIMSADILNYYITVKPTINSVTNYSGGEKLYIFATKDEAYSYLNDIQILDIIQYFEATLNQDITQVINNCSGQINATIFTIPSSAIDVGDVITNSIDQNVYVVSEVGYNSIFSVDIPLKRDYNNVPLTITKYASRVVMEVNVNEGVYFTNNAFVKALPQTIVPDSKTKLPSCIIGFEVVETIVDYIDDTSLLEPAQGSYNYTAPGADRYKIYLNLVSKPLINGTFDQTTITSSKFIELIRIKNGIVVSDSTDPLLGGLEDVLAKQMYDHAGNFIVSPFNITFNSSNFNHNETKLNATISSGKAYVFGYPFNASFPTNKTVDKARTTDSASQLTTNTYYGNSLHVENLSGNLPTPATGSKVGLYSVPKGSTSTSNCLLGYAYIRNIDYSADNNYTLSLYDISVPQQKIGSIKSVASISSTGFSANTVLNAQQNAEIIDPSFDKLVYKLAFANAANISTIRATLDLFTTVSVSSNTATISSGATKNEFPTGFSTSLSDEDKKQNFIIVTKNENAGYLAGQIVDLADVKIEIKQVTNNNQAIITFNNGYTGQIDVKYSILYTAAEKKTKTLHKDQVVKVTTTTYPTSIGYADVIQYKGVFKTINPSVSYDGVWSPSVTYGNNSIVRYGDKLYSSAKSVNVANIPDVVGSSWNLLQNVTNQYKLNNGQTEYMYNFGTITAKTPSSAGIVFVLFDYYSHSINGEYIAFDSYPVTYDKIPTTTINNTKYSFKDYIDFRPRRQDLSNPDTFVFDSYRIPSTTTNANLLYSMSFYLGRIDKLILTKDRKLSWLSGVPSYKNYIPPKDLPDAMTIATIQFDPYSPDLPSIRVKYAKHRRYTMDDIGDLDTRLQNVEYYTSLNLVEKATLSTNIVDQYGTRLKNGFIADSFTDFSIVDLKTNNKNISLDLENNLARPSFGSRRYKVTGKFDTGETSLINVDNLISFNYTELPIITQDQATGQVKINQFDCISYQGDLFLDPQTDVWSEQIGTTVQNIDEDTAALMNASEIPGLLFNQWNSIYATKPYDIQDTGNPGVTVNYNNVNYQVSSVRNVTKNTKVELLAENVKAKTRAVTIKFKAHGLAPLSRMFLYVNGHLVNAYVTPDENPMGIITSVNVVGAGSGYNASSVTASITANAPTPAILKLSIVGGVIDNVTLSDHGKGYPLGEEIQVAITGSCSTQGYITASTVPVRATNLYSNKAGECFGTLQIPNHSSVLQSFDVGELVLTVCDTPHYDLQNAIAVSHATFYSKTSYYKLIVDSIRLPYISKSGVTTQAIPSQTPRIIVPASTDYLQFSYSQDYSAIRSQTITVPVFLNMQPKSEVTVSFLLNASEDISEGTTISANKTTLTFTRSNYDQSQDITLTYDLGTRPELSNGSLGDNNLPTHIEFYATSDDERYNYGGSAIPLRSWLSSTPVTGTASTHLVPYKKYDNAAGPAAVQSPYITLSPVLTSNVGGESFFTVNYGGGHEIGWWTDSETTYPLAFTATVANTQCAVISHSTYDDYETSDYINGNVRTINKSDIQILQFKYWIHGLAEGTTSVTVSTVAKSNPNWTISSQSIPVKVGASLLYPVPQIVVHPNAEITESTGVVLNSPRLTTSEGGEQIIGISLSKSPIHNVTVEITSDDTVGGGKIYKVSDDGVTSLVGSSLLFTPSTWNHMKTVTVQGVTDPLLYQQQTKDYNVILSSSSTDTTFNNLVRSVPMKNTDRGTTKPKPPEPPPVVIKDPVYTAIYQTLVRGNSVDEGVDMSFTVETANVPEDTWLYWKISGTGSSPTNSADFVNTADKFKINKNTGTFTITAYADINSEGPETFKIEIFDNDAYTGTAKLAHLDTVNDTSTAPNSPPGATYAVKSSTQYINEGDYVDFTVETTGVANGTTLYWRYQFAASTNIDDFATPDNGSFTIDSVGKGYIRIYTTEDKKTETNHGKPEFFKIHISNTPGGGVKSSQISPYVYIYDTSQADPAIPETQDPVIPETPYAYPEVIVSYAGTEHTYDDGDGGTKDVIFNITLKGSPQSGDTITVTMGSDNISTGGYILGTRSIKFTTANYKETQNITMRGISLFGTDTNGVAYNALWAAAADLSTNFSAGGKIPLINDKFKFTTSVFAFTEYSRTYSAVINDNVAFIPTVTVDPAWHASAGEGIVNYVPKSGAADPVATVTVVQREKTFVVLKITATMRCIHHGTNNDSPGYKPTQVTVYGKMSPGTGTICGDKMSFSVLSAKSKLLSTELNYGKKGTVDPNVTAHCTQGLNYIDPTFYSWQTPVIGWGVTISENTKKYPNEGYDGGIGPAMPVEVYLKIDGFYFDVNSYTATVVEDTYSTTTSTTYRNDNYEIIGDAWVYSTNNSKQEVTYDRDALTLKAVHTALTDKYPLPPNFQFSGDAGADTLLNAYNIGVYQKIVDSLTAFIAATKKKKTVYGTPGYYTLEQEQAKLNRYTDILDSFKNLK